MKIGILTFHQSVNNGAVMQSYALSRRLREMFPQAVVEIVDYRMARVEEMYAYRLLPFLTTGSLRMRLGRCKLLLQDPGYLRRLRKRTQVFRECLHRLPLSPEMIRDDGMEAVTEYIRQRYDILIVGSDAVWNYVTRGFPNAYLPGPSLDCAKLSYAASCYGMDFLKRPEEEREQIGQSLEGFAFLGVRDKATEDMVRWSGRSLAPVHTCDPTVFLDVNDLPIDVTTLEQKLRHRGFDLTKPAIGMMGDRWMHDQIRKLWGDRYQVVALYEHVKGADVQLYDLEPYEWAYVFRYFKMTFTTYFPGTLLSLRNGVPVICIALETEFAKVHTPKTLDVLTRLGFPDWYFKREEGRIDLVRIRQTAERFLQEDFRQRICDAMDAEAQTFRPFAEALGKLIDKEEK